MPGPHMHLSGRTVGTLNGQEKFVKCGSEMRGSAIARSRCGVPTYWLATSVGAQMICMPRRRAASRALFILGTRAEARCALVIQLLVFHMSMMTTPIFAGSTRSFAARMAPESWARVCRVNSIAFAAAPVNGAPVAATRQIQMILAATGSTKPLALQSMFLGFSAFRIALSKFVPARAGGL